MSKKETLNSNSYMVSDKITNLFVDTVGNKSTIYTATMAATTQEHSHFKVES